MENKQITKRCIALVLALVMVMGIMPFNVFAETFKLEGSDEINTTDWALKEENLKNKNYWPLALKQNLHEVSTVAEPMKNPQIGYGGYFIRPDGRTVIRLTMRKFDKVGSGLWHVMQMKLEDDFYDKVDWNDTQTGIYKGVSKTSITGWYHDDIEYKEITPFADTSYINTGSINVKEINISDNGNTGTTAATNEVPINLVLKGGVTVDSFKREPLVQMRILHKDREEVACYTDAATGKGNYSSYTFSTIVPLKYNYEQNLLREIRKSVTTDRAFRAGGLSVQYNKEEGFIDVNHRYNKVPISSNSLYGNKLGYRQAVNKVFFDLLKPIDANGTIAHVFSTANDGLPSPGRLENRKDITSKPKADGSVPILKSNINFPEGSDIGFIQIANTDFYREGEAQQSIKTNITSLQPLESWLDGIESLLNNGQGTTVRYYVDKEKLDKAFKEDDGLQFTPFFSSIIMDNRDGQYKYTFKLTEDITINEGDKIKINFADRYGNGTGKSSGGLRNMEMRLGIRGEGTEMFLGTNFLHVGPGGSLNGNNGRFYEYTIQKGMGMKLKKGTEIHLFANYPDGGEVTLGFSSSPSTYKANYENKTDPVILDWQAVYSAGTLNTTFQKPDVDEIFIGDENITGRTYYNKAEINIKKSEADTDYQTIIAKAGTNNKDDSRIDVVVNGEKTKGYEFDTKVPGKEKDGKTDRQFKMPQLERDMPILFTNTNVQRLAGESRPPVIEQVQAKVTFDLNGQMSKENKEQIEKIAPLSTEYRYNPETGEINAAYKASGFQGDNVKYAEKQTVDVEDTVDGEKITRTFQNVLSHDGKAYDINNSDESIAKSQKEALKLRQMPDKNDITIPQGKRLLGWTTVKLEDKAGGETAAVQFNKLKADKKIIMTEDDWKKFDMDNNQNFIFDENSPIDKNRTVYAVYGAGINLVLHSNNTANPDDEKIIIVPITIDDIDKTNGILDGISSPILSNMKNKLAIKELPKVPKTGELEDIDKIEDANAKLFNIPKHSFIGWTAKKYTNDESSEFAAGNSNERVGQITKGEILVKGKTKRIPQKTEWLEELKKVQNTKYIPNGYSVAIQPKDINKDVYDENSLIKDAIGKGEDIHLYANYRPYFTVNVIASYKNIDNAQGQYGKYVDTVESLKKKSAKIGLLYRTAVTDYGTPTVHQNANYYPIKNELKDWDGSEQTLTWSVPGFDELGQRLSYVSAVVPTGMEDKFKNFQVPNWGSLGMKTYIRVDIKDGSAIRDPNAPKNIHENAGNPYGDLLAKAQAYSNGVDAFTSATSRKAITTDRQGTNEVKGYTIWNTSTPIDIPQPVFDSVYDTDKNVKVKWGEAEKNADIKKIKLTVADGVEVILEKQDDESYKTADGTLTAKPGIDEDNDKLIIGELNLTGKENKDIVAKYVVENAGQEQESPEGRVTISKKASSAPVITMKQDKNQEGKPVITFDIPNPILNKPTAGTVYQPQKWDKDQDRWVDVGTAYTMQPNDKPLDSRQIVLDPKTDINPNGVGDGDIVRIVSTQPNSIPIASTQTMDDLGNVTGNIDDPLVENKDDFNKKYVKIDAKAPEISEVVVKDEAFRRFIDLSAVIDEIPVGRKVTIEVEYTPGGDRDTINAEVKTQEDTKVLLEKINTILRKGVDENNITPVIKVVAVDEFGNRSETEVGYKQTYQLEVQVKQYRAGRKFVKVTTDRSNSNVKLTVTKADGSGTVEGTANVTTANEFVKITFGNYRLQSGDTIKVEGVCVEGGKTYTSNPMILDIK